MKMREANNLKEEGNEHFKAGRVADALSCYTKALKLNPEAGTDTATYLKNRAACFLKLDKYNEAISDCSTGKNSCHANMAKA